MAEMLTTELAGGGQLRVVPPGTSSPEADGLRRRHYQPSTRGGDRAAAHRARDGLPGTWLVRTSGARRRLGRFVSTCASCARRRDVVGVTGVGDESQLFSMMSDAGRQLRSRLGLKESTAEATTSAARRVPAAGRGDAALRRRAGAASPAGRSRSAGAVRPGGGDRAGQSADPDRARVGVDGARLRRTGQGGGAESVRRIRVLTREDRLKVEGRLYEAQRNSAKAIDVYRTLWGFFSDNIEYGLAAGRGADIGWPRRATHSRPSRICGARQPANADPRIDLAEAQAASTLGDFPRELAAIQRALHRAEELGARLLVARSRLLEGRSYFSQGQPIKAEASLESARKLFVDAGDRAGAASALNSLGTVLADQQDITRAQRMYEQSLATSEEIGDRRAMSSALNNLGDSPQGPGPAPGGPAAHQRSLALRREIGDRNWTAVSLSNIGVVLFEAGSTRRGHYLLQGVTGDLPRDRRQARARAGAAQPCDGAAGNRQSRRGARGLRGVARHAGGDRRQTRTSRRPGRARHAAPRAGRDRRGAHHRGGSAPTRRPRRS